MKSIVRKLNSVLNRAELWADWLRSLPLRWAMSRAGHSIVLKRGLKINHPERVSIGNNVFIGDYCWISFLTINSEKGGEDVALSPTFAVGDNCYIGRFATFACMNNIHIGNDVMIADRVFIGDCYHGYARRDLPIKDQYMFSPGPVSIGDGSWLGINVSVMPNVKIGKGCVIGANSVVTRDVPDYHVAAGVPARLIKTIEGRDEDEQQGA